jgi:hypothetical protein
MATDLFEFWRQIGATDFVHPEDAPTFKRLKGQHGFNLNCLPLSFSGPLRHARVVLLYLSPGLPKTLVERSKTPEFQRLYANQRTGRASLPGPDSPGHKWRMGRLGGYLHRRSRAIPTNEKSRLGPFATKRCTHWPFWFYLFSFR